MTLHQLEVFVRVAQEGSFTGAGRLLGLSEPAVSLQVKQLEQVIGAKLVSRFPNRPIRLTDAGQRVFSTAEKLIRDLQTLLGELETIEKGDRGTVHFAAGAGFCNWLLPPLYASFHAQQPGVAIRVETARRNLIEGLRQQRFELVVAARPLNDPQFETAHVADVDVVLVGAHGHRFADRQVSFEDLREERLVLSQDWSAIQTMFESRSSELGIDFDVGWEYGGIEGQISAVTSGLGIAPVPYHAVSSRIAEAQLAVLQVKGFPLRLSWHLIWKRDQLSVAAVTFRDYLLTQTAFIEAHTLMPAQASLKTVAGEHSLPPTEPVLPTGSILET